MSPSRLLTGAAASEASCGVSVLTEPIVVSSAIPPLSRTLVVSVSGVLIEFNVVFACLDWCFIRDASSMHLAGIHYFERVILTICQAGQRWVCDSDARMYGLSTWT